MEREPYQYTVDIENDFLNKVCSSVASTELHQHTNIDYYYLTDTVIPIVAVYPPAIASLASVSFTSTVNL